MNEEEKKETKVKQPKKAMKIVSIIIAIIAVIAIVIGILAATGKININFSKKGKMVSGIEKLGEAYSKPLENLKENSKNNNLDVKLLENLGKENAIETSAELSAKVDKLEIEGLTSSEKSTVKSVIDLVNKIQVAANIRYDGSKSAYAKLNGKLDDIEISGEALYDGSQAAIRSEEINSKWITISEKDIQDLAEENGLDLDELKETITESMSQFEELSNAIEIDEKTKKETKERYSKILKEYINDKNKDIKSEKATVKVDGKEKNCKKLTLKLNEKDIKKLAINYIDTFEKDEQIKKILNDTVEAYAEIIKTAGEESTAEELVEIVDELYSGIDQIKKEINEAEFEADIEFVVYASNTNIYRTDIVINIENVEISLETTFNNEDTKTHISVNYQGVKADIGTITVKEEKDGMSIKADASKFVKEQLGQSSGKDVSFEIKLTTEKSKIELAISVNAGTYGNGTLTIKNNITTNEDKEYADTSVISLSVDAPDYITTNMELTMKNNVKLGETSIPKVTSRESININDEEGLKQYQTESQTKLEEILNDLQSNEIINSLIENEF